MDCWIDEKKLDRVARIVATTLYHPAPDMSGDVWKAVGIGMKKRCMRAAEDILYALKEDDFIS